MHAGPGEVRIRVHAAAVNPTDILARDGSRAEQQKVDPLSYVPGMDVAGIVDEVGSDVQTGVRIGDAVMGMALPKRSHGAYREQIVLGARSVARAPAGTSHVEACTLPMNGLTARQSLDLLNLAPGQVLAVTGAAGAYGGYVIQQVSREVGGSLAGGLGFEPRLTESESAVLPLNYPPTPGKSRGSDPSRPCSSGF
jgi:NADPH2:quinone reductase